MPTKAEIIGMIQADDNSKASPEYRAKLEALLEMVGDELHPALQPWVVETRVMGTMVKHPFVFAHLGPDGMLSEQANKIYNWKRQVRQEYLAERDWINYLWAHERPWRMHQLEKMWVRRRITIEELRELLPTIWIDTEIPEGNQAEPMFLFREAGFVTDDPEGWEALPERMKLYRGVDGELELTPTGPSWTLSEATARFFAYRGGANGTVYHVTVDKSTALAYFTGREEAEIILDFHQGEPLPKPRIHETRANT